MFETFYLHLEFQTKKGEWSVNLPFVCDKCSVCCTLEDFLTAGPVKASPDKAPEVHRKLEALYEELGMLFEAGEAKYDSYTLHSLCPFLDGKMCAIYEVRPDGCRQFPNTVFGMQTRNCKALTRFKRQRAVLRRGRNSKETYHFTAESIKPVKFTEKQFKACLVKLRRAGITRDELALLKLLNKKAKLEATAGIP
ncbi:MAG: YkgJ family cysteine cluster protein [Candidatus Bathyarchaeota archaeon]|nr:YkgJ family cysteine cluster protein [Candidatus Bathyarchaeota archaeon]